MADIEALIGVASGTLGVLFPAFKVVQQMADSYGRIKFARRKCKAVIRRAALVIKEVHDVHRMNLEKSETLTSITELNVCVHGDSISSQEKLLTFMPSKQETAGCPNHYEQARRDAVLQSTTPLRRHQF